MFYITIPLDYSLSKKEQQWGAGLQLQGKGLQRWGRWFEPNPPPPSSFD